MNDMRNARITKLLVTTIRVVEFSAPSNGSATWLGASNGEKVFRVR